MMDIMKLKCFGCGTEYFRFAMEDPLKQICAKCGSVLEIDEDDLADRMYDFVMATEHSLKRTRDLEITLGG